MDGLRANSEDNNKVASDLVTEWTYLAWNPKAACDKDRCS